MSTLTVTNIKATGETASRAVSGVAAAWVNVNAAGFTVLDSLNASSVVDNSTGNYRINFSSGMANDDFLSFGGQVSPSGSNIRVSGPNNGGNRASTYQNFESYQQGTGGVDKENVGCGIMGDLA
jgi:hypothetical protein